MHATYSYRLTERQQAKVRRHVRRYGAESTAASYRHLMRLAENGERWKYAARCFAMAEYATGLTAYVTRQPIKGRDRLPFRILTRRRNRKR